MSASVGGSDAHELLWEPSRARVERAHYTAYTSWLRRTIGLDLTSYQDAWRWSVSDLDGFWGSIWDYFGVGPRSQDPVLVSREMPGATWFPGRRVNFAAYLVDQPSDQRALIAIDETGTTETLTYGELSDRVACVAAWLRSRGVGQGDRVVGLLPNRVEAVVAFLATASIGAIWSSCSPEFGARSVLDRFRQIGPTVVFACSGYRFGGRWHDRTAALADIVAGLPSVQAVVSIGDAAPVATGGAGPEVVAWDDVVRSAPADDPAVAVRFDHPLWILYSSGTTGPPKAIVHGHGGTLLEQLKAQCLHLDLHRDDTLLWYTSTGWVMWNLLVSAMLSGCTVVLYDGSAVHPHVRRLWEIAAELGVTVFGSSAGHHHANLRSGKDLTPELDLSHVHTVGSTGAPLAPEAYRWLLSQVGSDTLVASISGGTDVASAFSGSVPVLPVRAGEMQCRMLGAHVEAFDVSGQSVVGEVGELVVTDPMPSMPLYLWGDDDGSAYRTAYFETYPGVWRHGDWLEITPHGGCIVHGRSDSTLNRGGIRTGTAEFYRIVESLSGVEECIVVEVADRQGEAAIVMLLVLSDGIELDAEITRRVRDACREGLSPRHVPDEVHQVAAIPHTLNGKKMEVPVRRLLQGEAVDAVVDRGAAADPEAIDAVIEVARRRHGADENPG